MGRHCGFYFYRLVGDEFVDANVVHCWLDENDEMCNWLNIDGRCDATDIFLTLVSNKEKCNTWFYKDIKPEDKYTAYLLMNHPELDGLEYKKDIEKYDGWFKKYFYIGIEKFKSNFDFDEAQKEHDDNIQRLKDEIIDYKEEIKEIRAHQENAKTKVAFDCFEEKIKELKDNINSTKEYIKDIEEDDYDMNNI